MPWRGLHSLLGRGSFSHSEAPWARQAWHQWAVPLRGVLLPDSHRDFPQTGKGAGDDPHPDHSIPPGLSPARPKNPVWSFSERLLRAHSVPGTGAMETISQDGNRKHLPPCPAHSKPWAWAGFSEEARGFAPSSHWHSSAGCPAQGPEGREAAQPPLSLCR